MKLQTISLWMAWLAVGAIGITFAFPGCGAVEERADYASAPDDSAMEEFDEQVNELACESLPEDAMEEANDCATAIVEALEEDSSVVLDSGDEIGSAPTGGLGSVGIGSGGGGTGFGSGMGVGMGMVKPKRVTASVTIKPPTISDPSEVASEPDSPGDEFASEFDSQFDEVDRKLASLPQANIAFNTPETIPLGDAATIELLVSLKEAEEELRQAIRAAGPVETARVKVSPYLEARLTGVGFSIESVTPQQQLLSPSQRTQWRWNIEPTKAESLELTLTLSALISIDGERSTRAIQTFERTITVDVPMGHRVSSFVSANQEWLITLLVFPVAGWFYRYYGRRRKPPAGGNERAARRAA